MIFLILLCLLSCQQGIDIQSESATVPVERVVKVENKWYYITITNNTTCTIEFNNSCKVTGRMTTYTASQKGKYLVLYGIMALDMWLDNLDKANIKYDYKKLPWYKIVGYNEIWIPIDQVRKRY